jgi:hypothetical protein
MALRETSDGDAKVIWVVLVDVLDEVEGVVKSARSGCPGRGACGGVASES